MTATPTVHESLNPDSWIAEENDYFTSAYREKRKLISGSASSTRYETGKWSFGGALPVTD